MMLSWRWLARFPWPQHCWHITPFHTTWKGDPSFKWCSVFDFLFMSSWYSSVLVPHNSAWDPIVSPFLPLYFLPGGPDHDRTSGKRWVLLFEVEHLCKEARLGLSDRARLSGTHQIDRSPSSYSDVSSPFPLTPSLWTPQSTHPLQTWTFLWACNQNQAACNRGELFGLQTCCWGQRPWRAWIPLCEKGLAPWTGIKTPCRIKRWEEKKMVWRGCWAKFMLCPEWQNVSIHHWKRKRKGIQAGDSFYETVRN